LKRYISLWERGKQKNNYWQKIFQGNNSFAEGPWEPVLKAANGKAIFQIFTNKADLPFVNSINN